MTKILHLIILILIISCSQNNKRTEATDSVAITKAPQIKDTILTASSTLEEKDCVFNNDYKGLTQSWLSDLKINNYIWSENLKQALIPRGQDTIFVSMGGCVHFGVMAEIKLTKDNHPLNDSIYFIKKALDLAIEFKMHNFQRVIKESKIKKTQETIDRVIYEVEDDNPEDNLFYNGIEITNYGQGKRISLAQYSN